MSYTEIESRPWLQLFTIDFSALRRQKTLQLQQLFEPSDTTTNQDEQEDDTEIVNSFNIQQLPLEILLSIFSRLDAEELSSLAQVSTTLMSVAYDPGLWRRIAEKAWPHESSKILQRKLYQYQNWRRMVTQRPRLRTNGIYVVRHQSPKIARRVAGAEPHAPVFLMMYHRYLRFYTDGTVVELTTPEPPHLAYKRVRKNLSHVRQGVVLPSRGEYEFNEETGEVSMSIPTYDQRYPHMKSGIRCLRCTLQSSIPGAFNRLFVIDHYVTSDQGEDMTRFENNSLTEKPYRLVRLHDFKNRVYHEFPRDDSNDLAEWYEMKKQARKTSKQKESYTVS